MPEILGIKAPSAANHQPRALKRSLPPGQRHGFDGELNPRSHRRRGATLIRRVGCRNHHAGRVARRQLDAAAVHRAPDDQERAVNLGGVEVLVQKPSIAAVLPKGTLKSA